MLQLLTIILERRIKNEPIAYIRGFCDFYGRKFKVNKNVLVPRPESETFIELLKATNPTKHQKLLDIGTGSGVLATTAKLEVPYLSVSASDISENALKLAKMNAKNLNANISFFKINLINKILKYDYIFANLPYVPDNFGVSPAVQHEPSLALYGGKDGLDLIKELAPLAKQSLKKDGYILFESLPNQQKIIADFYQQFGFKFVTNNGLVQCFKKAIRL